MNDKSKKEAIFGYKKVNPNEKPDLVKGVLILSQVNTT